MGYELESAALAISGAGGGRWLEIPVREQGNEGKLRRRMIRENMILEIYEEPGQVSTLRMASGEVISTLLSIDTLCSLLNGIRHLQQR